MISKRYKIGLTREGLCVVSRGIVNFKVHWETLDGSRHELFMKGDDVSDVVERAAEYIKGLYMRTFWIVGIEESSSRGWLVVEDFEDVKFNR